MNPKHNATYQQILNAAEQLFTEKGYGAVSLQEIARAVEMRHASMYYYVPEGKAQLYIAVMERVMQRHGDGLTSAIIDAGDDLRAQLHAVAEWFAVNPPLDLGRIVRSDLPAINSHEAQRLIDFSLNTLRMPIAAALRSGIRKGVIALDDPDFAAMGLVGLLQSVHNIPRRFLPTQGDLTRAFKAAADMLLDGWVIR
ncbi:MAG: TetR/AcrR family transcriptional regulator [bacterium]|nr:TetR/AcrR family transcriptional regulator [bacterium]